MKYLPPPHVLFIHSYRILAYCCWKDFSQGYCESAITTEEMAKQYLLRIYDSLLLLDVIPSSLVHEPFIAHLHEFNDVDFSVLCSSTSSIIASESGEWAPKQSLKLYSILLSWSCDLTWILWWHVNNCATICWLNWSHIEPMNRRVCVLCSVT